MRSQRVGTQMTQILDITASFVGVLCLVGILWWLLRKRKKSQPKPPPAPK